MDYFSDIFVANYDGSGQSQSQNYENELKIL